MKRDYVTHMTCASAVQKLRDWSEQYMSKL